MKRSEFNNFDNFYNDVINNKNKNTDKKQFNAPTADGLNIRVPHDTVLHSEKEHTLTSNEWKDLLSNIDNIESAVKSHQKPRYSGIPVLLKVKTNNGCYGVVLEIFQKNNPIITTAFTDVESEIDNWIKVEAIPNGTETTFSDTRLNNIITHYAPNFKPKTYNETLYQSAVTAGAETSAETSDAQKEWQEKGTDINIDKEDYINAEKDIPLPNINHQVLKNLGKKDKPLILKSNIIKKNKKNHPEILIEEYNDILSKGLQSTDLVFKTDNKNEYYNFIHFDNSTNEQILVELSENKNNYEIVNFYKFSDKSLERKIKKANNEGGQFLITDSNAKGAAVLSALGVSPNNIITINSQNLNPEQIKSVDNQGTFDEGNPNIYYQPAYHGSPAKFDKFDHDYIGSGEGAQVHGYGTYVAKDKNIADERYRKTLSDTIGIGTEILVDNVTYKKIATNTYKKKENIYDSVDDYLNEALNFIEIKGSKKKALKYVQEQIDNHKDAGYFDEAVYYIRIKDALNEIIKAKITKYADDYGQLYEVEIPEDEEMLDEDLPFSEQPQKVQDAFGEMIKADQNGQLILLDSDMDESETPITSLSVGEIVSENPNGKKIYDRISSTIADVYGVDYAEADKLASELLNRYGIKGIKYNGQTDGQCYVIFNPENIDITRTFYQEAISPKTSQKAKEVVNALKKIADGSEEETVKDLRNDLEQYGGTNDVTFVFGNDKKGIKHIAQKHGAKTLLKVFDTVVDGKVLRYVPNKKTVVLSKGDYEAVLSLDENGNKKTWLLSGWNTKEKSSGVSREVGTQSTSTQIKPTFSRQDLGAELNNSITNSDGDFNPKQSQKRTGYVFQEPAQPNLFVENASQNHNKGFVGIDLKGNRGLTDINRNLILIGTTGDVTTVLHESAHYFLNMLEELERVPDHSPKVDDVLFAIRKTLKNDGTPFTRSQHEKFAKGFEHYIYTGNARNNIFKEIYEDIKNLLKNIYEFVQKGQYFTTGEGALTEEEMKNFNNVFDEIFKLENKTVKERVFAKVLALDEKEEDGFFKELTLFLSLFWQYRHLFPNS